MLELLLQLLDGGLQLLHLVLEAWLWYGLGWCWLHLSHLCVGHHLPTLEFESELSNLLKSELRLG